MKTNCYEFRKNTNERYRWIYNQEAMMVHQFLVFAKSSPNEILELEIKEIESILNEYVDSLKGINVTSTITHKVEAVSIFFLANNIKIDNDLLYDYDEEYYYGDSVW